MKLQDAENILVVEGPDDKHSVIGLMKHHCLWPGQPPWPVFVDDVGGVEKILRKGYLSGIIKAERARRIGVLLDADKRHAASRYASILGIIRDLFPSIPSELPEAGTIVDNSEDKRFGVWVMPDNRSSGVIEDFLVPLVPPSQTPIWNLARESVEKAISAGAGCGDVRKKAQLYTFLAWQEDPGRSPGQALLQKRLDPHAATAHGFVAWFKSLFDL